MSEGFLGWALGCAWGTGYWESTQLTPAPKNTDLIWSPTFEVDETEVPLTVRQVVEGRDWVSPAGLGEELVTVVEF